MDSACRSDLRSVPEDRSDWQCHRVFSIVQWVKMPFLKQAHSFIMEKLGRIEIAKQALNFSAAHFTIFSATDREDLHGHNFQLECELTSPINENGLIFDYALVKRVVKALCDEIDEKTLLPEKSPFLTIEKEDEYLVALFNDERIPFLYRDVVTLPIANTSVEELSHYFLEKILAHDEIANQDIREMTVKVSSSPGQLGTATWTSEHS